MIQKKICMLGAFAVGKTSLVRRFVTQLYADKYHTTVGVKVDKKSLSVGAQEIMLVLWDIQGEDEFNTINPTYLRGSSGYLLVIDGTRPATLETAYSIQRRVEEDLGRIPFVIMLNKSDLEAEWEITTADIAALIATGWKVIKGSAKTGDGVEEAFHALAEAMVEA